MQDLFEGLRGGTVFHPHPNPLGTRKSWLAHALEPLGTIQLDLGACEAIEQRGASILLVGVKNVEGAFSANQPVKIVDPNNNEIGRGISSFSSEFLQNALKRSLTSTRSPLVIHRDVLVLTKQLHG